MYKKLPVICSPIAVLAQHQTISLSSQSQQSVPAVSLNSQSQELFPSASPISHESTPNAVPGHSQRQERE